LICRFSPKGVGAVGFIAIEVSSIGFVEEKVVETREAT